MKKTKRAMIKEVFSWIKKERLSSGQVESLLRFYDSLEVYGIMLEGYFASDNASDWYKYVDSRVRWTDQDRDIVEDFYENVKWMLG